MTWQSLLMPLKFLGGWATVLALVAQGGVAEVWTSFHVKPVTQLGEHPGWGRGEDTGGGSSPSPPPLPSPAPSSCAGEHTAEHTCPACSFHTGGQLGSPMELWNTRRREIFDCSLG